MLPRIVDVVADYLSEYYSVDVKENHITSRWLDDYGLWSLIIEREQAIVRYYGDIVIERKLHGYPNIYIERKNIASSMYQFDGRLLTEIKWAIQSIRHSLHAKA